MNRDNLNYRHLHYFWVVARAGSMADACRQLGVAPSTVSTQLKQLEQHFGVSLFDRTHRALALTEDGRVALEYADQIFALGSELDQVLIEGASARPRRLTVGVSAAVPKMVVRRLLAPVVSPSGDVHLLVHSDQVERLIADLASHRVDLVLASESLLSRVDVPAREFELGSTSLSLYAVEELASQLTGALPDAIHGAPLLMPRAGSLARRDLDAWLDARGLVPSVVAELADSGLIKAFGSAGLGAFVAPTVVASSICQTYGVACVGQLEGLVERYLALAPLREPENPLVGAVVAEGQRLFVE